MIRCARFKSRKQVSGREGREIINLIVSRQSVILYLNITMKPRVIRFLEKFRKIPPVVIVQVWLENKIISRKRHGNDFSRTDWCDASGMTCSSKRLDMTLTTLYYRVSAIPRSRMDNGVWSVWRHLKKRLILRNHRKSSRMFYSSYIRDEIELNIWFIAIDARKLVVL